MSASNDIEQSNKSLPYKLAEEFSLRTNRCLFITGKAGTGKTTFLKQLREVTPKNMAVVAPTGVAAINAGGMTIHSFFQLPIRTLIPTSQSYRQLFAEQRMVQRKRNMLYHLELLVIDEISMVRADVLDAIDAVLRHYRYRFYQPFGGVQVVMIGDLMQLSPVVHGDDSIEMTKYYDGPYFFQSKVMQLDHVFRQQNEQFVKLLNEVRENRLTAEGRAMLASRYMPGFDNSDEDFHITLTTHNQQADDLNHRKLDELPGRLYTFKAEIFRNFPESSYPTEETLQLKEGARVMFIKNDDQKPRRFYNGKLGVVTEIGSDGIMVQCEDEEIEVEPMEWENIRYREDPETGKITEEMLGAFRQYPLRLAWAVTIHKSQGLTFDKVIIDAARAFASGQVYVALSRCRTLEGIVLSSPLQNVSLQNDRQVLDYVGAQPSTEQAKSTLGQAEKEYQLQLLTELYNFARLLNLTEQMQKHVAKCVSFNRETMPFLEALRSEMKELQPVAEKFQGQLAKIILSSGGEKSQEFLQQRMAAAADYFVPKVALMSQHAGAHPCRCKNKEDAGDFDTIMGNLFLVLMQKARLMQIVAKDATTEAYLHAKSRFVAPEMETKSAFEKPTAKKVAKSGRKKETKAREPKSKRDPVSSTAEQTYMLYRQGRTPDEIAEVRGLTLNTVLGHLAEYVKQGHLLITDVVPRDVLNRILSARTDYPDYTTLKEFYEALGGEVPYPYLRAVLEGYRLL